MSLARLRARALVIGLALLALWRLLLALTFLHGIRKIGSGGSLLEKVGVTGIGGHQEV